MNGFSRRKRGLMGVSITQDAVRLLQLTPLQDRWQVTHYARETLPPGAVLDRQIEDISVVGAAVARARKVAGAHTRDVAIAVPAAWFGPVTMPAGLSEDELAALAELEAVERLSSTTDDVLVDFAVLGAHPDQVDQLNVLLAATPADPVRRCVEALKRGGLVVRVVDVDTLALARASVLLVKNQADNAQQDQPGFLLIDIDPAEISLHMMQAGNSVFARRLRRKIATPVTADTDTLAEQISDLLHTLQAEYRHVPVQRAFVIGTQSRQADVLAALAKSLPVPVEVADPIAGWTLAAKIPAPAIAADSPALVMACGLALRGEVQSW